MGEKVLRIGRSDQRYPAQCLRLMGEAAPATIELRGEAPLLCGPLLGLLVSRRCPGDIVLETFEAVRTLRPGPWTVVGGFHSPMERQCLESLLLSRVGVVLVLPRPYAGMRVRREWWEPLERGKLLILSPFPDAHRRSDRERAHQRNVVVAALSDALFVPYASERGSVEQCAILALEWGIPLLTVGANRQNLLRDRAELVERWKTGHLPTPPQGTFVLT